MADLWASAPLVCMGLAVGLGLSILRTLTWDIALPSYRLPVGYMYLKAFQSMRVPVKVMDALHAWR